MRRQLLGLVLLQGLDLASTWLGINAAAYERNPVGVALLGNGFHSLVLAKAAGTLMAAGLAVLLVRLGYQHHARLGLVIPCAFMVAVVGWNSWIVLLHTL